MFSILSHTPSAPVPTGLPITFPYPDGLMAADFAGAGHTAYARGLMWELSHDDGDFTLEFGDDDITFTHFSATSIPAATLLRVEIHHKDLQITSNGILADKFPYTTGTDVWGEASITPFGRSLLDDDDDEAARGTLGLGSIATQAADAVAITGGTITGTLTANLSVTAVPTYDWGGLFGAGGGTTWRSVHRLHSEDEVGNSSIAQATVSIVRNTVGAGSNAPHTSDQAMFVECSKTDYLTSAIDGTVSGMTVVTAQGILGDSTGYLANVRRVDGGANFVGAFESAVSVVDSSGTKLREFKVSAGGDNGGAADIRGGGHAFLARPNQADSQWEHGLLLAGSHNENNPAGSGFVHAIRCSGSLSTSHVYYQVTGDEHADGSGLVRTGDGTEAKPAQSFVSDDETGFYRKSSGIVGFASEGTTAIEFRPNGIEIIDAGGNALIDFKDNSAEDFDVRLKQEGNLLRVEHPSGTGGVKIHGPFPTLHLYESDGATDEKWLRLGYTGAEFKVINLTDAGAGAGTPLALNRDGDLDIAGGFEFAPSSSETPTANGDVVFELTNNTTFTVRAKGSDGVVRSGTVALA